MSERGQDLIQECKRQMENCLYTSTSLYIWLRWRRFVKNLFIVLPLILGAVATWELVTRSGNVWVRTGAAVAALLSGLPSVYAALKYDEDLDKCRLVAGDYTNLRDRFRQVGIISSKKSFKEFEADFRAVMDRMEQVRLEGITAPEWCFREAQAKVKKGDYDFDIDQQAAARLAAGANPGGAAAAELTGGPLVNEAGGSR